MNVGQEPLVLRRTGLSPVLSLLASAFALASPPAGLAACLRRQRNAPLPRQLQRTVIRGFGARLEPRYIFRAGRLDQ